MSNIKDYTFSAPIIHEYELSVWKDVWARPTLLDSDGSVAIVNNVPAILNGDDILEEEKSAILSTDEMIFGGKAINIIFKVKINGTHELTFDLPGKYVDPNTGKRVHNYLRDFLDNETKVKLFYKDKWYSFYVKKVTEKREKNYNFFNYTCEDSYITELSKTGYKLTFNEYTKHYIEDIHTFSNAILEDSEWSYDAYTTNNECDLKEYQEDKLVEYKLAETVTVYNLINTDTTADDSNGFLHTLYRVGSNSVTIEKGTKVYGFYSEINKNIIDTYGHGSIVASGASINTIGESVKQIIYVPNEEYEISGKTIVNKNCNYIIPESYLQNVLWNDEEELTIPHFHRDGYYGLKIVYNDYTEYCEPLDKYVKRYYRRTNDDVLEGEEITYEASAIDTSIYSYTKTHVMVPEIALNYAANSKDMTDTTGWSPENAKDKLSVERISRSTNIINSTTNEEGVEIPEVTDSLTNASPATYGIAASGLGTDITDPKITSINGRIINTGPYSRKLVIDSPTVFALKLNYCWIKDLNGIDYISATNNKVSIENNTNNKSKTNPSISICCPLVNLSKDSYYKDIVKEASALDDDGNYTNFKEIIRIDNINSDQYYLLNFTNEMLKDGSLTDLFIVIDFQTGLNKLDVFCIENLEFFEAWTFEGKHTQPKGGWGSSNIATLASYKPSGTSTAIKDYYIVPKWRSNEENVNYQEIYSNWKSGLQENSSSNSAAGLYSAMMEAYDNWKALVNNGKDYTLVTCDSIVTGETFEEELYFTIPASQPLFAKHTVNYCNPYITKNCTLEKWVNNCKYRTLKQEKSNRFNLTQELSKLFKVYPVYEVAYYPNGAIKKILYDENGTEITLSNCSDYLEGQSKSVSYVAHNKRLYYTENRGKHENKYGFKYGHNLNSISRTIDSSNIVSKMFVQDNTSKYGKDGICSIARATDNIGKENYLLNFNYFINRNKVSKERIENDVYSTRVKKNITWADTMEIIPINSDDNLFKDLRPSNVYDGSISDIIVYQGFLPTLGGINTRYDYLSDEMAKLEKYQLIILESAVQTYTAAIKSLREQLAKQKQLFNGYVQENTSKKAAEYQQAVERISSKIISYEWQLEGAESLYNTYADLYNLYKCEQAHLLYWKRIIENDFNLRYESLLREGFWQDSKYLSDDAYYLDAEKVLVDSCGPKITYNISVTDLSVLKRYKFTDFDIGDVTYVEDYEFFEDDPNSNEKYYQEKTIVSAITYNLDNPSKNSISLQNYTTKFDDLFSRITASVQSLTFNESIYQRAGKFTSNGQIDADTLQNTFNNNNMTVIGTQDVRIDGNGILVTDLRIPSNKVKVVGTGVLVTSDGGNTWRTAIGEGGINANALNIGSIDTQKITIFNDNYSNFVWDKDGITAYGSVQQVSNDKTEEKTTSSTYVRFNQYGLFFTKENAEFEEGLKKKLEEASSPLEESITDYIMEKANIAITFNGFSINAGKKGRVKLNSTDGLVLNSTKNLEVKIGYIDHIADSSVKPFWGLYAHGAYIEGKIYSDNTVSRNIQVGTGEGSSSIAAQEYNRIMLNNGRLYAYRTLIEKDENNIATTQLDRIGSFGAGLLSKGGQNLELEQTGSNEYDIDDYIKVGTSIHLEEKGQFVSIATSQKKEDSDKIGYLTKIIYVRNKMGSYDSDDTLFINCKTQFRKEIITQGEHQTSDERLKYNIVTLDNRYISMFDKLEVKSFKMKDDTTEKTHLGFIAQDVEKAIVTSNLQNENLNIITTFSDNYKALQYTELLSLCVLKIKQLEAEIQKLKHGN